MDRTTKNRMRSFGGTRRVCYHPKADESYWDSRTPGPFNCLNCGREMWLVPDGSSEKWTHNARLADRY